MNEMVQEWIAKAEGDYLTASREVCANPPNYDAVCFHDQQCIEKFLKAILIAEGEMPPRTHDLTVLDSMLRSVQPDWRWPISHYDYYLRRLLLSIIRVSLPGQKKPRQHLMCVIR